MEKILVTGFGPFGSIAVNASWEAVKLLPEELDGFEIVKEQVPVTYTDVDEVIPRRWSDLKPKVCILYI